MSRNPVFLTIVQMEVDIADVGRWGDLLYQLAASPNSIEPGVLHVIAGPLTDLGRRLDANWNKAFEIARDQPCA
jgi:hypothetical protein